MNHTVYHIGEKFNSDIMALFKRKKSETGKDKDTSSQQKKGAQQEEASMKDLYASENKKKKAAGSGEKKQTQEKKKDTGKQAKTPQIAYRVIIKPLVTEKVGELGKENKYVFQVANNANKIEVAKAIEEVYKVRPEKVNVVRMQGKRVRFGRLQGKRSDWKKAIVKIPEGKSISVHEGV